MQSIQDIIDTTLSLGFSYFYGLGDDQGFLRRMLHTNPSLDALYAQLQDDINFIEDADIDYFRNKTQLNAFKSLKKYLNEAKDYVKKQLKKKHKKLKIDGKEMKSEYESLRKELQDPYISEKEREQIEWEINTLFSPTSDNLDEVKSKFEAIDHKVKQELKHVGFEEEEEKEEDEDYILPEDEGEYFSNEEKSEHDNEVYVSRFEPSESKESDLDKIVDEGNRRYSMREFNELYEDMVTEVFGQNPSVSNKQTDSLKAKNTRDPRMRQVYQSKIKNRTDAEKVIYDRVKKGELDGKIYNPVNLRKMKDDEVFSIAGN